jgi:hypothetical protein
MNRGNSLAFSSLVIVATLATLPGAAQAAPDTRAQVCAVGAAGVGRQGTLICKDVLTGDTTQSLPLSATVSAAGGIGGSLSRHGERVLVTNQAGGATLLRENHGWLNSPIALQTGGEGSLSGTLSDLGAYVLTGTRILFFPAGKTVSSSSRPLIKADGSAAQVALAGGFAYVSEKTGSLESFALADDGNLIGSATPVAGIPAGTIVGITGADDLVVAPIAHLATNFNEAAIPVAAGSELVQLVPTKELAACWTAHDDGEVCVANPGSMTVSCGHIGRGGFTSYTSAAANPVGYGVFDLSMRKGLVGIMATKSGAAVMLVYVRAADDSDFLTLVSQFPLGAATATGALLLPALSK